MSVQRSDVEYRKRLALAAVGSLLIHIVVLSPAGCPMRPSIGLASVRDPIVIHLQPSPAREMSSFVDTAIPAEGPVGPTDLIAEQDSTARDTSDIVGTGTAPHVDQPSDFDALRAPKLPVDPTPTPAPVVTPEPERTDPSAAPERTFPDIMTAASVPKQAPVQEATVVEPAPMQMARAEPLEPPEDLSPGTTRAREGGGAKSKGFLSFEAKRHEFAPYLRQVRERVEARWRDALLSRYSGAGPAKAVIDCSISPDGHLVELTVVDPGDSLTYAPVCMAAIRESAPFPPFPFEVPAVYRNKNLEIRWTFSLM